MPPPTALHSIFPRTDTIAIAPRAPTGDDLRRRLVVLTLARLGVAAVLLVATVVLGVMTEDYPASRVMRLVVGAIFAVSVGYALALRRGRNLRSLAIVQIALDLAAWAALVAATGGPASPMSFFFALSALTAALVLGERAARITAVAAVALYGAVAVWSTSSWASSLAADSHRRSAVTLPDLVFQIVTTVIGVLLVAALGGALASRLTRAGGALARVEASRAALASLYEDVLRSIPVALLTCTRDGRIESANPVAAELFATPVEHLLGSAITTWLPFVSSDAFAIDQPARAGDDTLTTAPGRPRVAFRIAPLYDRAGEARGGLVVLEDRSAVESMREAVQRAERLAVLGRLAAGLAHEIRNPLGAISGCVELVREAGALAAEDRELLATVSREVARLNDLVSDMLTFARPRVPEWSTVELRALARDVAVLSNAAGARATVRVEPGDGAPVEVRADANQLRQVLWNLVRNATQASPEGGVVEIEIDAPRGRARLAVCDRGRGVASEMRERIFDVFYSEGSRGTGLGLAIVKQIIDAHGARIEAHPRDGGGTEMRIDFAP